MYKMYMYGILLHSLLPFLLRFLQARSVHCHSQTVRQHLHSLSFVVGNRKVTMSSTVASSSAQKRATKTNEIKRRTSLDSDGGSSCGDMESVISESFVQTMMSTSNDAHHIAGYLLKQSNTEVWQKRYFETNSTFLTYYKTRKMSKLLAALNMASVGEIAMVGHVHDAIGDGVVFQLELKDRNYVLRTSTVGEAEKWMYKLRLLRDEARASSIPEETSLDVSTREAERVAKEKERAQRKPSGEWAKAAVQVSGDSATGKKTAACCAVS